MNQNGKQKQLPEPKKDKVRPPSPPAIIRNEKESLVFSKVGFLGEVRTTDSPRCLIRMFITYLAYFFRAALLECMRLWTHATLGMPSK